MGKRRKFLIIAGEASGDRHAADLVKELKKQTMDSSVFIGIGGDKMAAEGVILLYHIHQMAFLGFAEIIQHLPFIFSVFKRIQSWIKSEKPDGVILVDYPGFNLRLAKIAHKFKVPVVYYICPQLWAWGEERIEKIRNYVNLPLVIFKFEEHFYNHRGIQPKFVGHPLLDQIKITLSEKEFKNKLGLQSDKEILALLPGSRINEIKKILPVLLETYKKMNNRNEYYWILGKAQNVPEIVYDKLLADFPEILMTAENIHHLIKYSKVVLVASGTATLETGYLATPMVVLYKVSPLSYIIGKRVIRLEDIALVNIVSGKKVVPELIQKNLTAEKLIEQLHHYLEDPEYYQNIKTKLQKIPDLLGAPGASKRAAKEILNYLSNYENPNLIE